MEKYILRDKEIIKTDNLSEWGKSMEFPNRIIEQTEIQGIKISTVFLGIDHAFFGEEPLLFETMIFGGELDGYQERYSTWDEAYKAHHFFCKKVIEKL
jgi:hypothetical protein